MPRYARSRSTKFRARKPFRRTSKPVGLRSRRSYRPSYGRRRMTRTRKTIPRRRVLNLTSVKKRDVMLPSTAVPPTEAAIGSLPILTAATYTLLWEPTWRNLYTPQSLQPTNPTSQRTSSTCFFVGVKDKIEISTTNGQAWQWRRIVFTAKGLLPIAGAYRDYTAREVEVSSGNVYPTAG